MKKTQSGQSTFKYVNILEKFKDRAFKNHQHALKGYI